MKIADDSMKLTKALPAAGATAVTASVDLGADRAGPIGSQLEVRVSMPALSALVDAKTVIISFEDSADDSSFAAVAGMGSLTVTGSLTPGAPSSEARFYLAPETRQYLRGTATVLAAGGDNTSDSFTVEFAV